MGKKLSVPDDVLKAFNLSGTIEPLEGGSNSSCLVNNTVLKPVDNELYFEWLGNLMNSLECKGYRISNPVLNQYGTYVYKGWIANKFEPGMQVKGYLVEKLETATILHKDLLKFSGSIPNTNPWAYAHKIVWENAHLPNLSNHYTLSILNDLLSKTDKNKKYKKQLVHCDLSGNILFDRKFNPLIIDFSLTEAPIEYANAILICDCIAWENASVSLISSLGSFFIDEEMIIRALIFRLSVAAVFSQKNSLVFLNEYEALKPIINYINNPFQADF